MSATKPFAIDKWQVYEAYQAVKANAGSAGVDKQSIEAFEEDLKGNLYRIDLESDVLGKLLSAAGQGGRHSEEEWRGTHIGRSNGGRSRGADGGQAGD